MIAKLLTPLFYARQKEEQAVKTVTRKDRIKADRVIVAILFLIAIVVAVIFA